MRAYTLNHVGDRELLESLTALVARDRAITAALLAHLAEVESRRLYAPAGHSSMFEYCVRVLGLSEDAAYRRIRAARTTRRFPSVFAAVEDGRLSLSTVLLLTPHLTTENSDSLLGEAAGKSRLEVELLLARRFPRTETLPLVCAVPDENANTQLAPAPVEKYQPDVSNDRTKLAPAPVEKYQPDVSNDRTKLAPAPVGAIRQRDKVAAIAHRRFAIQCTVDQSTHDKLRYAQSLLSHQLPCGDVAQVLDKALDALVAQLEKRKFAKTDQPRAPRPSTARRTIPAHVKRTVWTRDRGQCTFVGANGRQCSARRFLEFDHVDPVARGGEATVKGIRLRCRAHNQYEAERAFGEGFMRAKRTGARRLKEAVVSKSRGGSRTTADPDVLAALRSLGFRADESRRAAALCESIADASLEKRVKLALTYFRPRTSVPAAS